MPNSKREFIIGEVYHAFNRGVEKRIVFMDDSDYYRFIFSLYECNDRNFVVMRNRMNDRILRNSKSYIGATYVNFEKSATKRKLLVDIIAFVLMPNHYHLILRPLADGGVSLFMNSTWLTQLNFPARD
ncbi:MAG: hypothetical protein WBC48_02890 [Minisyncoccales bacterium]